MTTKRKTLTQKTQTKANTMNAGHATVLAKASTTEQPALLVVGAADDHITQTFDGE